MICPKCNALMNDGDTFCSYCGSKFVTPSNFFSPLDKVSKNNPVWRVPYRMITSPMYIISSITLTISIILAAIYSFYLFDDIIAMIYAPLAELGFSYSDMLPAIEIMDKIEPYLFLGYIPDFILILGIWLTLFLVAFSRPGTGKTAGLTLVKIILVFNEVLLWICMFLFEIIGIVALILTNTVVKHTISPYGYDADVELGITVVNVVVAICLLLIPAIYVLYIAYFKGLRHSINAVKETLSTGEPSIKVSTFAGVMSIILSAFYFISMLLSFINGDFTLIMTYGSVFSKIYFFAPILSVVTFLLSGIMLLSYKGKLLRAIEEKKAMCAPNGYFF